MSAPSIPSPFTINVPDAVLRDLADRLPRTRFPQRTAAPWQPGADPDYLRQLVTYWHDDFDWRARERELNAPPQFTADIDGQRVHFAHVPAAGSGQGRPPLALVLTHGWPSSFLEMLLPRSPPLPTVDVPAGITLTPEDRDYPREHAERSYTDIRQGTGPTRGGHFLALEDPGLLAADLRAFFRPLRGN